MNKYAIIRFGEITHSADTLAALQDKTANVIIIEKGDSVGAYICLLGTRNYYIPHSYIREEWSNQEIEHDVLNHYYGKALRYFGIDLLRIIN